MKFIITSFRRNFLAGLLVTVPFGLTIFVLFKLGKWIVNLVSAAPEKFLEKPLSALHPLLFEVATFAIGLIGTVLIVLIAGAVARNFIGRKFVGFGEKLISKIPFARTVYTATKQVIEAIFLTTGFKSVNRVVIFEFPRKGMYSIGLVTGVVKDWPVQDTAGKKLLSVFLPTTPNPTSGYYMVIPEDEVTELPVSVEEAFKIIMSGGIASKQSENAERSEEDDKKV
ncbi:MAG TPA: DUF502 domain-containing protein [Thermodesulfobacteriota bacterium]|nr:DUF502 domain-containing protein [Thermodesulfobacteriota bacterium]